jgi:uncharacterized protein (DUF1697 family)
MARGVIFLRGVNVGGRGAFAMVDLKGLLEGVGATHVKTHLNSGNAVFSSTRKPDAVARELELAIEAERGATVTCFGRSAAQLRKLIDRDPFQGVANDGSRYVVMFLSGTPDSAAVNDLASRAGEFAPEAFVHNGHEFYVWCPNSLRDAKLPLALGRKRFGVTSTARNWNTVKKMLALAETDVS